MSIWVIIAFVVGIAIVIYFVIKKKKKSKKSSPAKGGADVKSGKDKDKRLERTK